MQLRSIESLSLGFWAVESMEVPAKAEEEYAEKSFRERGGIKIVRNPSERKEKVLNTKDNIDSVQEFSIFDLFPPISRIRKSKDNVNSVEAKPILQRFSSLQTGLLVWMELQVTSIYCNFTKFTITLRVQSLHTYVSLRF